MLKEERWDNKSLFLLIGPLIIEQVLTVTMGAADTVMVSSIGEFAVSGVNIVDNINNLLIIAFAALSTGGAVVVSQYIGRKDPQKVNLASRQLLYAVTVISLLLMTIAISLRAPIIRLLYGNIDNDVMEGALVYFLLTAISYPFLAIYSASGALFRASGNSKTPMRISIISNILNIAGNYFFIFHAKIGITGAGLATLISRVTAALVLTSLLANNRRGLLNLDGLFKITFNRSTLRSILNVGIPSGLESSMFQIGRLLTQRLFTLFGTAALAANAVAGVINSFSFMPGMAFGVAILTVTGQCIGAGDYESAKKNAVKILKAAWIFIFCMSSLIFVLMNQILKLFDLGPEAVDYAKQFLRVHCISLGTGWVFSFALPNALRAAGDAKYVMIAATISMWVVRVSVAYLLDFVVETGPVGVWLAMGGDFIVRGAFYLTRWFSGKWQNKKVIAD